MAQHGIIRRHALIIEKISRRQFPRFNDIFHFIKDHGIELSERTVSRDLEQIRMEYGIEIRYNRAEKGYYIDHKNSLNLESFFRFLEIVNTAALLTESLKESKDALKHISFDKEGELKGIGNLKPLLKAIKDRRLVSFTYYNFLKKKKKALTLKPYMLKEYQSRWYVVGVVSGFSDLRIFGVDRIENLEISADTFKPSKKLKPEKMFEQIIGLVDSKKPAEKIILSFTPRQGEYIKTLPLHPSQTILEDNENECRICIEVIPNYELTQQILKHSDTVKVLEPQWLAEEIKDILKKALEKY